jgi:hypothetical protein
MGNDSHEHVSHPNLIHDQRGVTVAYSDAWSISLTGRRRTHAAGSAASDSSGVPGSASAFTST